LLKLGELSVLSLLIDPDPLDLRRRLEDLQLLLGEDGVSTVDDSVLGGFLGRADGVGCLGKKLVSNTLGGVKLGFGRPLSLRLRRKRQPGC
jgi:hypothetical protein